MATVLIAEDDDTMRRLLERATRRSFPTVEVIGVPGGTSGLEALRSQPVDVVVSDIGNPEMSGLAFLRETTQLRPAPVFIILSGDPHWRNLEIARRDGAFAYMSKPVEWNEFRRIVAAGLTAAIDRQPDAFEPPEEFHMIARFRDREIGMPSAL